MQAEATWTDIVQALVLCGQLLVLVVAAVVAWRQVVEAKRLREDQARPFVVVDFDVKDHLIFIVVSNIGNTLATKVHFDVTPPFESTIEGYQAKDLKMFREGIPTLAPGKVMRTLFDNFPQREPSELPDAYKVTVRYADERGRRTFTEQLDLDIDLYRNLLHVRRNEIHHVNETLRKMLEEMKRWRGVGGRGLLRMSPKERRAEGKRQSRELEQAWWKRTARRDWRARISQRAARLRRGSSP